MDEAQFPANSRSDPKPEASDEKKVEQVTTGAVSRRKKPLGRKFLDLFVAGESQSVGRYLVLDVIMPAFKDVIADVVTQAVERTLFGESRPSSRRHGSRPGGSTSAGYTSYNRYSQQASHAGRDRRPMARTSRATHDFDEIILATRAEAEQVVERLFDLVSRYDQATVGDLYDLVGISSTFTDQKWGWQDIRGASVTRTHAGYLLDLPKPEALD